VNPEALFLVVAVAGVGVLHTIVPDHWVPLALIAWQRGWSTGETASAAFKAGIGHVLSSLAIGMIVWLAGVAFATRFGSLVDTAASLALVAFGGWIAVSALHELRGEGMSMGTGMDITDAIFRASAETTPRQLRCMDRSWSALRPTRASWSYRSSKRACCPGFRLTGAAADAVRIAYRQEMIAAGRRPATINRRLEALCRLGQWAHGTGVLAADVVRNVRPVRTVRNRRPAGLTDPEVHALLSAAGASGHGLASRNYALVQLMLQTGIRVGEVGGLQVADVTINDRSGNVCVRQGKGIKARDVPLNATVRRALRTYLGTRASAANAEPLFLSTREEAMPVRSIQAVIAGLARRARLKRIPVSAHTLRHTFALGYLRDNPGKLVELAGLLGHESLDTTAVYTRPSSEDLAADLERSHLNVDP